MKLTRLWGRTSDRFHHISEYVTDAGLFYWLKFLSLVLCLMSSRWRQISIQTDDVTLSFIKPLYPSASSRSQAQVKVKYTFITIVWAEEEAGGSGDVTTAAQRTTSRGSESESKDEQQLETPGDIIFPATTCFMHICCFLVFIKHCRFAFLHELCYVVIRFSEMKHFLVRNYAMNC